MTTLTKAPDERKLRPASWLLALSPIGFVLVVATFLSVVTADVAEMIEDVTPDQMATVRGRWAVFHLAYGLAVTMGAVGMALLDTVLRDTTARRAATVSSLAIALSVASVVAHIALRLPMAGFTESRLDEVSTFGASMLLSYLAIWFALGAVVLSGIALHTSGLLRRTGLVVAILAAAVLAVDVITRDGWVPPFVVAIFWLAIGIGLLRRRVASPV